MRSSFRLIFAASLLCLAACQRPSAADGHMPQAPGGAAATAAGTPAAANTPPASASTAEGNAGDIAIADRYACDANTNLVRASDGSFSAEIPGNPSIRLERIAGSEPPVFTGSSLYLRIGSGGNAILSQGDRTNELRCAAG